MDAHAQTKAAIVAELQRQSDEDGLNVETAGDSALEVDGHVDLDALAAAVVGAIAGGP